LFLLSPYNTFMALDINLEHNFNDLEIWLDDIKNKAATQAARSTINRSLIATRKLSIKLIKRQYRVKKSGLSATDVKKAHHIKKARGGHLDTLFGEILFAGKPIPLLSFVSGSKNIIEQKGIKVKKRKKLKAEIRPGKKVILKGAFIGKVHSKQVFKRGGKGLKRQAGPSITEIVFRPNMIKALQKKMQRTFDQRFPGEMQFRLDKLTGKVNSAPLKKL